MSEQGLEIIDTTVQKTHAWIADVAETAHLTKSDAYKALRAVLQTLRDRLPVNDAAHFAAELPLLIRGVFFEGWRPSEVPKKLSREEFLHAISEKIVTNHAIDPVRITTEVLRVVSAHLSANAVSKFRSLLPAGLQTLWPDPAESFSPR